MTAFFFILTFILAVFCFYFGINKDRKLLLIYLYWQAIVGLISFSGFFITHPKTFPLTLIGSIGLVYYLQKNIKVDTIQEKYWLAICSLRIAVELILFRLAIEKKIPTLMTFSGWNFDIIIGISALFLLIYYQKKGKIIQPFLFKLWNLAGLCFLFCIVALAILSSPLPIQQFAFEQPNIAVLHFPYSLLPSGIVSLAVLSHIILLKSSSKN